MRFLIAAVLVVSSAAVADAKAVWRHYPAIVRGVAFAYVGPGNAIWRVYRAPAAPRTRAAIASPSTTPKPRLTTPAPMVLLAPGITAKSAVTAPPLSPVPVITKPVESAAVTKAPETAPTLSMAEPVQAEGDAGWAWARLVVTAAITAIAVAMAVSGLARRRKARPGSA